MFYPFNIGDTIPEALPFVGIGCNEASFIFPTGWFPNFWGIFELVGAVPSRSQEKVDRVAPFIQHYFPKAKLGCDYRKLVKRQLQKFPNLVVGLAVETPFHYEVISELLNLGVRHIITDKPATVTVKEATDIAALIRKIEKETGVLAQVYVTFNHRFNEPVHVMRELVQSEGADGYLVGFLQDWFLSTTEGQQFEWRAKTKYPPVTDLGAHVLDGLRFVSGRKLSSVVGSVHMETRGGHGYDCFDHCECDLLLDDGTPVEMIVSQTTQGHADDMYLAVCLTESNRCVMWRQDWHPDALWVTQCEPGMENTRLKDQAGWTRHLRGHGGLWSEANLQTKGLMSKNPPGHNEGWDNYWRNLFMSINGDIHRRMGENVRKFPKVYRLTPPTLQNSGLPVQRDMKMIIEAWGGEETDQATRTSAPADVSE